MRRIKEAIIVEGKYDVIRVQSAVDAVVIPTNGFSVFRSPDQRHWISRLAQERGIVILTDSDSAGMLIRNALNSWIPAEQIKHAYIPPIAGKEKRKATAGKEGLLGVEGMDNAVIITALETAGATFLGEDATVNKMNLTKADLYEAGLSGQWDSASRRERLLRRWQLPSTLSANRLLEFINATVTPEDWETFLHENK